MITQAMFASLDNPVKLAFLARLPATEGAETASNPITATSFKDESNGLFLVTNNFPRALSPFTGKEMAALNADKVVEIEAADFNESFVKVCNCSNPKCGLDLFTTPEVAELASGEDFHCPTCGTVNQIESAADTDADTDADTEEDPMINAPIVAGDDEEDELEDAINDDADDDDDADPEDIELFDKNGNLVKADGSIIKTKEELDAEAEEEETESQPENEDDNEFEDVETSAAIQQELAGLNDTLEIDLSAHVDIEPQTIRTVALSSTVVAGFGFDNAAQKVRVFGYFSPEKVSPEVAELMHDDKRFSAAVAAAINNGDSLTDLGFEPMVATVAIAEEVKNHIEEETASLDEALNDNMEAFVANYKQSFQIALAGMNKGHFDNPLVDALADQLARGGIKDAHRVALAAVTAASDEYALAAETKANELVVMDDNAREAVAKTIQSSNSALTLNRPARTPIVATATVELPEIAPKEPKRPRVNMFERSGYSGAVI